MTAPGSGEQITAELAEALDQWASPRTAREVVAALLPVVEAYATRKAAEELRAAAEATVCQADRYKLRGRAKLIEHGDDPDRPVYVAALTATHPDHRKATT